MIREIDTAARLVGITMAGLSLVYVVACIVLTWRWQRHVRASLVSTSGPSARALPAGARAGRPSISVLKPLCGSEPGLERNLRSFCEQEYPAYEVVVGARSAGDPALAVARRVAATARGHVQVLAGSYELGSNQKVNTLARLAMHARSEILVLADSDICVGPTYLATLAEALGDPSVGVATCLYRGAPTGSVWSRLGALSIDEWFAPSVLVARAVGSEAYCSGATIAVRRDVLARSGGFEALAPLLADDYELGRRVRALGLRCVIVPYEVATTVDEPSLSALVAHELRWTRTIRTVEPLGHFCSVVTYTIPMAALAALMAGRDRWVLALLPVAVLCRLVLHWVVRRGLVVARQQVPAMPRGGRGTAWLVPLRDILSFGVWAISFANRRVTWRQQAMQVRADGVLHGSEEAMPA